MGKLHHFSLAGKHEKLASARFCANLMPLAAKRNVVGDEQLVR
jgi:hypothetical protein